MFTLDFLISIGLCLLVFGIFSRVYGLIRKPTLINIGQIFSALIFFARKSTLYVYKQIMQVNILDFMFLLNFAILVQFFKVYLYLRNLSLSKFSRVYAYLGAYAYCFGELFQGLCLFGGLCLLGSLEYTKIKE